MDRHRLEAKKCCIEEVKILSSKRKSRFHLEMANWETSKLLHQLELVQKQWDESSLEEVLKSNI